MTDLHPRVTALAAALSPANEWATAYPIVENIARDFLNDPEQGAFEFSTNEVVEALWPESLARGEGITTRKRLYKALLALAPRGLADCATRGEERKVKHSTRLIRPWLWHAPKPVVEPALYSEGTVYVLGDRFKGRDGSVWEMVA